MNCANQPISGVHLDGGHLRRRAGELDRAGDGRRVGYGRRAGGGGGGRCRARGGGRRRRGRLRLLVVFTFVFPIALLTTYPAMALLGRLDAKTGLAALAGGLLFAAIARRVWRRALALYTSASS